MWHRASARCRTPCPSEPEVAQDHSRRERQGRVRSAHANLGPANHTRVRVHTIHASSPAHLLTCSPAHLLTCSPAHLLTCSLPHAGAPTSALPGSGTTKYPLVIT